MSARITRTFTALLALVALALGGSALAAAATNGSSAASSSAAAPAAQTVAAATAPQPPAGGPGGAGQPPAGPHVGANGKQEVALTGETAAKVKAAALAKVAGGTVERVETDVDHGSPYEAHVRKSDGTQLEVLVDKDFKVTAVNEMGRP